MSKGRIVQSGSLTSVLIIRKRLSSEPLKGAQESRVSLEKGPEFSSKLNGLKFENSLFEEETKVIRKSSSGRLAHCVIVASIALAFGLADARQSFAGCGGYCEARQALAICHEALKALNLTARGLDVEFEVCKGDPASYLQLERVAKDLEINAE